MKRINYIASLIQNPKALVADIGSDHAFLAISQTAKLGIWWVTIGIAIVIIILFATYLIVVSCHYNLVKKENKAKDEYNKLANSIDVKNFNYLETLAKQNDQLQKAIKLILEINKFYKTQLDELKLKLLDLTIVNERFQLRRSRQLIKEINKDIYNCRQIALMIQSIYTNSTDYSASASKILAKYRVAYNDIKDFYTHHLTKDFKQIEFMNAMINIGNLITNADDYRMRLNNEKLVESLNNLNEYNKAFFNLVKLSYTYHYIITYIKDLKSQLDQNLNTYQKKISKKEYSEALRVSSNVKELVKSLSKYLQDLNFESARVSAKTITTQLIPALNVFKEYDRIALLISNGLSFAKISLDVISNNINELDKVFEKICKYFNNDNMGEIQNEANLIKANFNKLKINYANLEKRQAQEEYFDRIIFLKELFGLIKNISDWEKSLNDLYQKIVNKYDETITLLDKLYDMQWTLAQFIELTKAKIIKADIPTVNIVNGHMKTIELITKKLNESFSGNFNMALEQVLNIEKDVAFIYTLLDIETKIRAYAKSLIFYTNKFRLEDEDIANALKQAEELYKQNQHRKVIELLVPVLENIKKSAKANGYSFK